MNGLNATITFCTRLQLLKDTCRDTKYGDLERVLSSSFGMVEIVLSEKHRAGQHE